jgi:Tol biopolymer transport system component
MCWSHDGTTIVMGGARLSSLVVDDPKATWQTLPTESTSNFDSDWNPISNQIAYLQRRATTETLRMIDFPAGPDAKITEAGFRHPSWGPDGYRIIVHHDQLRELVILDARHPDPTTFVHLKLDGNSIEPDWSSKPEHDLPHGPVGGCLVVSCRSGDDFVIYTVKADDSEMKELATFKGPGITDPPIMSFNGKRAACVYTIDGKFQLFVSDLDGKQPRKIAAGSAPCFSPDGSKLAFLTAGNVPEINIVDLSAGTTPARRSGGPAKNNGDYPYMGWSPDGSKLAMITDLSAPGSVSPSVYTINSDGSKITKLVDVPGYVTGLRHSADGKSILLLVSGPGGVTDAYTMAADGTGLRKILQNQVLPMHWTSADGKRMLAAKKKELFTMNMDGSDVKKLIDADLNYYSWNDAGETAACIGLGLFGGDQLTALYIFKSDGTGSRMLQKVKAVQSFEWCREISSTKEKNPATMPSDGDFVLKGGKYQIRFPTFPGEDMIARMNKAGWEISGGTVTRKAKNRVGPIGAEKDVTYTGTLNFTGPPDVLKPGTSFDLSMALSGEWQSAMEGQWRLDIPYDKHEGVEHVQHSKPGTQGALPVSGNVKVTMLVKDGFQRKHVEIALTIIADFEIVWEYERK